MGEVIKFPLVPDTGRHAERAIRVGDPVTIRGPRRDGPLTGHVVEIHRTADPAYIIATGGRRLVTSRDALDLVDA